MRKMEGRFIVEVGILTLFCAIAIALVFNVSAFTAQPTESGMNWHAWTTMDRDDLAAGAAGDRTEAEATCRTAEASARYPEPAAACIAAYEEALIQQDYERAMLYAATGCRMYLNPSDCRRVAGMPLLMGNAGLFVPATVADEMRRIADFVCLSGSRITSFSGTDVTGRECSYFARQFALASNPEYAWALEPAARTYFERVQDVAKAGRLYRMACGQLGYANGCEDLRELGQRVVLSDLEEAIEILEQEAGRHMAEPTESRSDPKLVTRR